MFKKNNSFTLFQPSLFYLVMQQLLVASSSIWITLLIKSISDGQVILNWLWLYLLSLLLPYIPGALALVEVSRTQIRSCVNYANKFARAYQGKIVKWSNNEQHDKISSILAGEANPTINGYIEYCYHLSSSGINVIFNLSVLAFLIDSSLIVTYILGVFFSSLILFLQKNPKQKRALKAQESRIYWISLLTKAWDNILLNNLYNFGIWNRKANEQKIQLIDNTISLEKFNQFIGILMAFALIMPSVILIGFLAIKNLDNFPFLAILTVLFPRLFQILTYSYELLFYISDFPVQKTKLKTVMSVINDQPISDEKNDLLNRINWDMLSIKHMQNELNSPKDLLSNIPSNGRITLLGENGSGKSSLLQWIKMHFKDNAFYLPSKHDLLFDIERNNYSTGQRVFSVLNEVKENVNSPIILLDEWDANLDHKNRELLSNLIDDLSKRHCIIEVLHEKHHKSC